MAVFLLAVAFNFLFHWNRWREAHQDRFAAVSTEVNNVSSTSSNHQSQFDGLKAEFGRLKQAGDEVVSGADARFLVLELLKAVNSALPVDEEADPMAIRKGDFDNRPELFIEYVESQYFSDLGDYYSPDA